MEARIILTHTCNFNCWFCHGEGWAEKKSGFIKKEKLFYLIDQLNKEFKLTNITLSGGEPLLHPEIEEIINFISDKHIKVSLVTNGALIKKYISKLAKVDLINLSIHTLNPLVYEVNSKNKVALEEAVSNIEALQSYYPEKDIRINIVVDRYFINNTRECLSLISNAKKIKLIELFPPEEDLLLDKVERILIDLGYLKKEDLVCRRKKIYFNDAQVLFLTRIFCSQMRSCGSDRSFCIENNEINISPNFIVKKCRYDDGYDINKIIQSKDTKTLNAIINNVINLKGVVCKYE